MEHVKRYADLRVKMSYPLLMYENVLDKGIMLLVTNACCSSSRRVIVSKQPFTNMWCFFLKYRENESGKQIANAASQIHQQREHHFDGRCRVEGGSMMVTVGRD